MKKLLVLFMVAGALLASPAQAAGFIDGNRLMKWAMENKKSDSGLDANYHSVGLFQGYIQGVSDSLNGNRFCLPRGVNVGQLGDVVIRYLEAHPEWRYYSGNALVIDALEEAFPCKD